MTPGDGLARVGSGRVGSPGSVRLRLPSPHPALRAMAWGSSRPLPAQAWLTVARDRQDSAANPETVALPDEAAPRVEHPAGGPCPANPEASRDWGCEARGYPDFREGRAWMNRRVSWLISQFCLCTPEDEVMPSIRKFRALCRPLQFSIVAARRADRCPPARWIRG